MKESLTLPNSEISLQHNRHVIKFLQILGGSLFLALCSQIKIPLFWTPVPITLQTLAVMLMGGMLGRKQGALSVLLYLGQIGIGLPVCAGGIANPLALIGPAGGYFCGFVIQAYLVGHYLETNHSRSSGRTFITIFLISLIQLLMGAAWLGYYVDQPLLKGFYPFLPGDIIKCIAATICLAKYDSYSRLCR